MREMQKLDGGSTIEEVADSDGREWTFSRVCKIIFQAANPAEPEVLAEVLSEKKYGEYTSAIIIPPRSSKEGNEEYKDPEQRDNWALRVLLMLKRLEPSLVHIVCENAQDVTATLVVVPSGRKGEETSACEDWVNA